MTGRRDRGEHASALRIDLLDAILRELIQVLSVIGGSRMGCDVDRSQHLPILRIERVQRVAGGKPDVLSVVADPVHLVDAPLECVVLGAGRVIEAYDRLKVMFMGSR